MLEDIALLHGSLTFDRNRIELRERQHGDILRASAGHALCTNALLNSTALGFNLVPDDTTHRLLRLNPRPARLAPAGAVEHRQFDPHTVRFFEGVTRGVKPSRLRHLERVFNAAVKGNIADHRTRDPHLRHRLKVLGNPLFRDITIQPIPVAPWLSRIGGLFKYGRQRIR